MSCMLEAPPCSVPQPMNYMWVADATPKASSTTDKMCILDGVDDIITIELPVWCNKANKMGTLWIDMLAQVQAWGNMKTILFDAYAGQTPTLRWFLQGDGD